MTNQVWFYSDRFEVDVKQAEEALWTSEYFTNNRFSMLKCLEYIECQTEDLKEI